LATVRTVRNNEQFSGRPSTLLKAVISGLSDRIEIESYFVIESNVLADIKSNRMQIKSNDFFDFRYDSIRFDLEENVSKKTLNCDVKKKMISEDGMSNEIFQYFCHPGGQSF
jgi:hypothetical protein